MAVSTIEVLITADASNFTVTLNQGAAAAKQFAQTAGTAAANATGAFSSVGQTLKTLAPAFLAVGAATVGAVTKGIAATQQWASDTRALQKVTGQTAEEASTLLSSANLLGIGVDELSVGFGTLSKNIVNGAPNLEKYGIAVRDANGEMLPFNDILGAVSDEFVKLPEGPEQAAFAMNVFGRSGKALIPILAKGREGMGELAAKASELGLVMGQDDLDASKSLTAAQRELGLAFKGAAISLGKLFVPALTRVVQVASKAIEFFTRLPDPVKEVGVGLGIAAGAVGVLTVAFNGLSSTFGPVIGGITGFGKALLETGLFQNASAALQGVTGAVELVGAEVQKQSQNIQGASDTAASALSEVGAASTLAANAVTVSAARSAAASAGLGASIGADAAAAGGFFSRIAAGAATVGSTLAGVGTALAGALSSPVAIIIGIVAAVTALTVVVVKNWDAIKQWATGASQAFGPVLDKVGGAFDAVRTALASVGPALHDFIAASSDAFASIGDALGELGRAVAPLLPLLAPIGRLLGAIAVGPLLLFLKGLALGFKVLALGLEQGAKGIELFSNFVQKLAVIIGPAMNVAINATIDGINLLIAGWNKLLPVVNLITHADFQHIDALDHVTLSSGDAASATDAFGSSAAGAADDATDLADVTAKAASGLGKFGPVLQKVAPLLEQMGTSVKDISAQMQTAFDDAQAKGEDTAAAVAGVAQSMIESAQQARQAFRDQARSALTFTTSMLSSLEQAAQTASDTLAGDTSALSNSQLVVLRDQANLTARDILHTFSDAAAQSRSFGRDLLELARVGGRAGKDLATSLLESGDVLAAQVIADAPNKIQGQIVSAFGKSETAADTFSQKLTDAIVGPLKTIRHVLVLLASAITGLPPSHFTDFRDNAPAANDRVKDLHHSLQDLPPKTVLSIKTDAPAAIAGVANLNQSILNLPVHTILDIKLNTHGSDLPDAVLRKHLFDPMKRSGFTRVGDTWTLPLDVAASTVVDPVVPSGSRTGGGGLAGIQRLIRIEVDNRGILKDIRQVLRRMDGVGGSQGVTGGTGSGTGGTSGSTASVTKSTADALHRVLKLLDQSGVTRKEGIGVVRRVAQEGSDRAFIRKSVAQVADELGKSTAKLYGRALRKLDDATLHSDAKRAALIKAALETQDALKQAQQDRDPFWWMDYATKGAPMFPPSGHTRIDPNLHNRDERSGRRQLYITRQHIDDQMAFQETYRGF